MRVVRSIRTVVGIWRLASITAGGALSLTGAAADGWHASDVRSLGLGVAVTGIVLAATRYVNRPADEAWSDGYEAGYDKGWRDCNRAPQLTVTPIRRAGGAEPVRRR